MVIVIAIPVVAAQFLPWWGTLLVIVGEAGLLIFGTPRLIRFGAKRLAKRLFEAKSIVLRGAEVLVHDVQEVPKPESDPMYENHEPDGEDDDPDWQAYEAEREAQAARYVMVDCTITPRNATGVIQHWDPSDLQLCPYGKKTGFDWNQAEDDSTDDEDEGHIVEMTSVSADGDEADADDKFQGPQRLRLVFACPADLIGRAKLRYYFVSIGDLQLP